MKGFHLEPERTSYFSITGRADKWAFDADAATMRIYNHRFALFDGRSILAQDFVYEINIDNMWIAEYSWTGWCGFALAIQTTCQGAADPKAAEIGLYSHKWSIQSRGPNLNCHPVSILAFSQDHRALFSNSKFTCFR